MQTLIISDTACLILLDKIGRIDILKGLYGQITVTTIIAEEFKNVLPSWILIKNPQNSNNFKKLSMLVDPGEASAIALSQEILNSVLIIDDLKARKLANKLGLRITGTIGILLLAKKKGVLNSIEELIVDLRNTNFRLSDELIEKLRSGN